MTGRPKRLPKGFKDPLPGVKMDNHKVTSNEDVQYNCIAYAAGVTDRAYWPNQPDYFWPPGIPNTPDLVAFIRLFESLGYQVTPEEGGAECAYVPGLEKVAIYTLDGQPTHAARQIGPNAWVSKLGPSFDIEHKLNAVSGGKYGEITVVMQRKKA